jgi:hypothetical protein
MSFLRLKSIKLTVQKINQRRWYSVYRKHELNPHDLNQVFCYFFISTLMWLMELHRGPKTSKHKILISHIDQLGHLKQKYKEKVNMKLTYKYILKNVCTSISPIWLKCVATLSNFGSSFTSRIIVLEKRRELMIWNFAYILLV